MVRKKYLTILIIFFLSITGILLLVFLNSSTLSQKSRNLILKTVSPVQRAAVGAVSQTARLAKAMVSSFSLSKEIERLKKENLSLQSQIVALKEVQRENEILRSQLSFNPPPSYRVVTANVIARNPDRLRQQLLIDQGTKSGLYKDAAVLASGGILIGRVKEVLADTASILLLNDQRSAINALTEDSRASGLLKVAVDGSLYLELILQEKEVKTGERVMTSGLGGIFPKGLLIGEVREVKQSDLEAFKKAKVELLANPYEQEIVFVLLRAD